MTPLTLDTVNAPDPTGRTLSIAVVPDSFKGSATAEQAADAIAAGLRTAFTESPFSVQIHTSPLADGGEGTLDAFLAAWQISPQTAEVSDALGRPVTARYALSPDGTTAVIEAAQANGLPLVSDAPLRPLEASSRGVGQIVADALDAGVDEIILCIGGSASTDGGTGLLSALGARFVDDAGAALPDGGGALAGLTDIDVTGLHPRARDVTWRIACDVTNPLTGDRGAAAVFGPQKGAGDDAIAILDTGLARLVTVLLDTTGHDIAALPGMGAAGGLPAPLSAFLDARLVAGSDLVLDTLGVAGLLQNADLVITGEGCFDDQSFDGKVVDAVRRHTPRSTPVIVIAGGVDADPERIRDAGITAAVSIAPGPRSLDELTDDVTGALTRTAHDIGRLIVLGNQLPHPTKDTTP